MKKVVRSMGNMLIALSVAVSMFSNACIGAQAAEDEPDVAQEYGIENPFTNIGSFDYATELAKAYYDIQNGHIVDTVYIDFSQNKVQTYEGKPLTTEALDQIDDLKLNDEAKNVVFINSLYNYNHMFSVEMTPESGREAAEGRMIIDEAAGQYIKFKADENGTVFDASEASGVYETVITYDELFEKSGSSEGTAEEDAQMALFSAYELYGVNSIFGFGEDKTPKFTLRINFGEAQKAEEEATEVEEETPAVEEETPAVEEENKEEEKPSEETPVVEEEKKEEPNTEEDNKEVNNTVLIDFSEKKVQRFN
ncbi:hypothetical protein, partial [Butyrivibrio sp. AD3002]|uniref:hypothetical protein n=1 Tax=Butyrivibrio sp. AD3002 TaxID=1280670 RepID=UPI0005D26B73